MDESEAEVALEFRYDTLPGRTIFGQGSLPRVADQAAELGGARALVITGGSAKRAAEIAIDALDDRVVAAFTEIAQHVPQRLADAATECAKQIGADLLVAVGGGSATGLAKTVAVATGVPIIAVPTTYAGSEMTPIYGITGDRKITRVDARALPRVVVYDPDVTRDLPARVTATSGLNAMAHCIAALQSERADPVSSLLAVAGLTALAAALPRAVRSPYDDSARAEALYGAHLAGRALNAGTGLHHKLCHVIGGEFGLVHAEVHAALLPYTTAAAGRAAPAVMTRVADTIDGMGIDGRRPPGKKRGSRDAGIALRELALRLGAPTSLAEIGVPEDRLPMIADRAAAETGVEAGTVLALLHNAYQSTLP